MTIVIEPPRGRVCGLPAARSGRSVGVHGPWLVLLALTWGVGLIVRINFGSIDLGVAACGILAVTLPTHPRPTVPIESHARCPEHPSPTVVMPRDPLGLGTARPP